MADHGILFSAPMVQALLAGTKTQTRRAKGLPAIDVQANDNWHIHARGGGVFDVASDDIGRIAADYCAYSVGDRLWVREAWRVSAKHDATAPRDLAPRSMTVFFEAGGSIANQDSREDWRPSDWPGGERPNWVGQLRASMHLPRWASRLTLIVTGVRVQRLQDISEQDARAEGLSPRHDGWFAVIDERRGLTGAAPDARAAYALLWTALNGAGSWAANPWVAAYTFTVEARNIDGPAES